MFRMTRCIVLTTALMAVAAAAPLTNTELKRTIDLSSSVARVALDVTVTSSAASPSSPYLLAIPEGASEHLAFISAASAEGRDLDVAQTVPASVPDSDEGASYFSVALPAFAAAGASFSFSVSLVYTHVLTAQPRAIAQGAKQLVVYHGNHYYLVLS